MGLGVGFGLDDLLLGFGEIGFGFPEAELLLGGIELDDDVAGRDQFAGFAEVGDGHVAAADHGRGQHLGVAALEFAAGGHGEGDAAAACTVVVGSSRRRWWYGGADHADGAPGEGADDAEDRAEAAEL